MVEVSSVQNFVRGQEQNKLFVLIAKNMINVSNIRIGLLILLRIIHKNFYFKNFPNLFSSSSSPNAPTNCSITFPSFRTKKFGIELTLNFRAISSLSPTLTLQNFILPLNFLLTYYKHLKSCTCPITCICRAISFKLFNCNHQT